MTLAASKRLDPDRLRADERVRLDECRQATLDFCNSILADHGLEPVVELAQGVPGDCHECVISATLRLAGAKVSTRYEDGTVTVSGFADGGYRNYFTVTAEDERVPELSAAFDAGLTPDLERAE